MYAHSGSAAAEIGPAHPHRRVTSFRSRRSTLSDTQQAAWDRLWPAVGAQARPGEPDGEYPPLDAAAWFGRRAPLVLEVGCGTGISTLAMAAAEPHLDVIAVEVYKKGLAQLLCAIDRTSATAAPVTNIRLIRGDAVDVLHHLLAPGSLSGVRVFFPDPWPKARHHKRRLLQSGTLATMAARLAEGGVLHIATDHADYTEWIRELLDAQDTTRTHLVPLTGDSPVSLARPTTKFEGRAANEGRVVTEFVYTRAEADQ